MKREKITCPQQITCWECYRNVDYSKEFAPYYPDAPFTGIMKSVYDDAVKNSIIREVKFIADPSGVDVLEEVEVLH